MPATTITLSGDIAPVVVSEGSARRWSPARQELGRRWVGIDLSRRVRPADGLLLGGGGASASRTVVIALRCRLAAFGPFLPHEADDPGRHGGVGQRSIPAHTGKPGPQPRCPACPRVYPRPHGSRVARPWLTTTARIWSKRTAAQGARATASSGAGSVQFSTARSVQFSVAGNNPRPHGEASCRGLDLWDDQGLSPPTRGSRQAGRAGDGRQGSIPAHTGKPTAGRQVEGESRVYPRPHGEAVHLDRRAHVGPGLSPPTRGSRVGSVARVVRLGSIPAHTGKPRAHRGCRRGRGVYPRPHGEAS